MPRKPKHPCATRGCPRLTHRRYCEEHQKQENKRYETYQRDPRTRQRYGATWRRVRAQYVSGHPLCEQCAKEGRFTPTEEVHHITPLSAGGTHEEKNLMSLCSSCHSRITARESGCFGR